MGPPPPSPMEAVFTYVVLFASIDAFLATIADSKGTHLAVILNDADLTAVGARLGPTFCPPSVYSHRFFPVVQNSFKHILMWFM